MIEQDTIRLLRECDSGIKMGVQSISDVARHVKNREMKKKLAVCKGEHKMLENEIDTLLRSYGDRGKEPNALVTGMSRMKTNMRIAMNKTDSTIAGLMTDGCNMGVKSLSGYLNKYKAADEESKDIAKRLILLEDQLATDMRAYL
ncbi:MAG: hypothetical protein IJW02_03990 [Clostridia bacterium]|nr:hypothetical protein [Clostridia bacterium]